MKIAQLVSLGAIHPIPIETEAKLSKPQKNKRDSSQ